MCVKYTLYNIFALKMQQSWFSQLWQIFSHVVHPKENLTTAIKIMNTGLQMHKYIGGFLNKQLNSANKASQFIKIEKFYFGWIEILTGL